jgi:hypothetical protein
MKNNCALIQPCAPQNNTNFGAIKLANYQSRRQLMDVSSSGGKASRVPLGEVARHQSDNDIDTNKREIGMRYKIDIPQHRGLQSLRQVVKFDNCLFQFNSAGPPSEITHYGVILAETPNTDVVVTKSIFWYNTFADSDVVVSALARVYRMPNSHICTATLTHFFVPTFSRTTALLSKL